MYALRESYKDKLPRRFAGRTILLTDPLKRADRVEPLEIRVWLEEFKKSTNYPEGYQLATRGLLATY